MVPLRIEAKHCIKPTTLGQMSQTGPGKTAEEREAFGRGDTRIDVRCEIPRELERTQTQDARGQTGETA